MTEPSEENPELVEKVQNEIDYDKLTLKSSIKTNISTKLTTYKKKKIKNRKSTKDECRNLQKWDYEKEPLWRIYMQTFAEDWQKHAVEQEEEMKEYRCWRLTQPLDIPRELEPRPASYELNAFNTEACHIGEPVDNIWQRMRNLPQNSNFSISHKLSDDLDWPKLWPCSSHDEIRSEKIRSRKLKLKKIGELPCKIEEIDSPGWNTN